MGRFVEGEDRSQRTLLPERLDDYVTEDNPVRVVDVFVDNLDLTALGFERAIAQATGRPGYHPATLLKIYIYGYLNRVQSSRRLEREAQRNIELMWLTGRLSPDFKTIADFRRDNGSAIRRVCREFVVLCRRLDLFSQALVAIDGSKFKAVNNRDRNYTRAKVQRRIEQIEESVARYLSELDSADRQGAAPVAEARTTQLHEKVEKLQSEMQRMQALAKEVEAAPDQQISLTDPDARSMATSGKGTGTVGYNVQTAVDAQHHLIVDHQVTNIGNDRSQLATMAKRARTAMQAEHMEVVADRGYFSGEEIVACEEVGITAYVPRPQTSNNQAKGLFGKRDFVYLSETDSYRCPAGQSLIWRFTTVEKGLTLHCYWSSACKACPLKTQCTSSPQRRVKRWEHEAVIDAMQQRLDQDPDKMRIRRQTVEHPFGTLKAWMGSTHFLMRTLNHVSTEMSLHVLAYNLKRVMKILGIAPLMQTMCA
ncbi:transposase [Rhodanobacter sp. FW510-R12]|uniref:IS1182 family transposase n=1 Tax=unclassified Rhodanobacter TaxID=2621553 RepID=UPI0007AA17A8|nr:MULTISPECIES: IS1182 family transposase [unclassified Rhodanobacter]KZC15602.1 transposase [Rhodanobacter sp. FW104-R8]KZC28311.1 transposase [Rhodanobacter sp. FW510-T8]KZC32686.1 transposase [Rhodanobacter sp. FW510-R10]